MDAQQTAAAIDRLDKLLFKARKLETELHELAGDLLAAQREIAFSARETEGVNDVGH